MSSLALHLDVLAAEKAKSALLLPEAREHLRRRAARRVRASIRFLRLVVQKFWLSFVLIWVLLTVGTLVIHTYARKDGIEPDYLESLFATYSLFSLESVYPMPKAWAARAVYFGYPLIGLLLVADTVVRATLLLFSRQENQKEWTRVLASTYRDHIILCGLGHVGYRILERLLHWHLDVVVIEKNTESSFLARTQQMGVPVLLMDARQEESLDARRLNPHIRVVLRMFDENIANKLRDAFHLDVAFSSAAAAAPLVAASVLDLDILGSFTLDGRELFTAKIEIGKESALLGTTIAYLANTHRVMVLSRKCGETPSHLGPAPEEQLTAGDILVLHGELDTLRRLSRLAR